MILTRLQKLLDETFPGIIVLLMITGMVALYTDKYRLKYPTNVAPTTTWR